MTETDLVRRVKEYRLQHKCSLQEAIDAVRGQKPQREMTEKTSVLGQVEQVVTSLLVRTPDMSGDHRVRLRDDQYRQVQSVALEVQSILSGGEASGDQRGSSGTRAATVSHEFREGQKSPTPQELEEAKADLAQFVRDDAILLDRQVPILKRSISTVLSENEKLGASLLEAGWRTMDAEPAVGRKFIALYNDGSGAAMFWRHEDGLIDHNGDDVSWPLTGYDRWSYLPDDLEFWCETWPDDPLTLPTRLSSSLEGGEG